MEDRLVADKLRPLPSFRIRDSKVINCLVNHNEYINSKLREVSVEEGLVIAEELFQILDKRGDGIGLAANQVGVNAQVAVVNVREPLVLINPKVISKEHEIDYYEGCLSYPKDGKHTKRYRDIHIQTAQEQSGWLFSGAPNPSDARGTWEEDKKNEDDVELGEPLLTYTSDY